MKAWTVGDPAYGIPGGFPASKATIGFPFYYRGWTGVPAGSNHGLYQSASGPSPGHPMSGNTPGTAMYKELSGLVDNPSTTFFDPTTQSAWFYDGTNFYGGSSVQSIKARMDYVHCNGLGGAMMFSLYDLDPAATLFHDVVNGLASTPSSCDGPPPTDPTTTTTTTQPPQGCTQAAWVASQVYVGGNIVSYNGHKWTAKWWTQGDIPGNNGQDVWTDNGAC
jgi:chitinase